MFPADQLSADSRPKDDSPALPRPAAAIPSDGFTSESLKGVAAASLSIVGAVAKFKSNRKDWANFGQYVQRTVAGLIHSLGALDTCEVREADNANVEKVLEVLRTIQAVIDKLQKIHLFRRMRVYSKDPETMANMKMQLDTVMMPFALITQSRYEGTQPERLLQEIHEIYRYDSGPQHPPILTSAGVVTSPGGALIRGMEVSFAHPDPNAEFQANNGEENESATMDVNTQLQPSTHSPDLVPGTMSSLKNDTSDPDPDLSVPSGPSSPHVHPIPPVPIPISTTVMVSGSPTLIQSYTRTRTSSTDANKTPLTFKASNSLSAMPTVIFNTGSTPGGMVANVAGDYNVYEPEDDNLAMKAVSDKLGYAQGASWDPDLACLPGTRASILSLASVWARSLDRQNIFWLNGVAGSGKSAIAHSVCQLLRKDGLLASSFFFSREFDSRNTSQLLISTITRDIAALHPVIAADICTALENEPALASASLTRQFDAFILEPLRRNKIDQPIVVVVDALDEAVQDDSGNPLLTILRDKVAELAPQLRLLITSRPTRNITQYLSKKDHVTSYAIAIDSAENLQDVEAYIDNQVRDSTIASRMGSPWPDEVLIRDLKSLADGLFIWIVTIFGYLRSAYKPRVKLRALLSKSGPSGVLEPNKKMDALYTAVLDISGDWGDPDFREDYVIFMGAIMGAKRPLSLEALRALHGDIEELSPEHLLHRFGAVLVGLHGDGETIRILHLSFREFITDRADNTQLTRKFHISEKAHSQKLALLCLETMVREIAAVGISGTNYLLTNDEDQPGIPEVTGVSEHLLYGCDYWVDHISAVEDPDSTIVEVLQAFLIHHSIVWAEVVSSQSTFRGSMAIWHWLEVSASQLKALHDNETYAQALNFLSSRFSYAGRHNEALTAIQESVFLFRDLAADQPAAFNVDFADSLQNLALCLSKLGRREEALAVIREAVVLRRAHPLHVSLALSLNSLSVHLAHLGQREEALAAIQEAMVLRRALATERPAAFNSDLADSLTNLSGHLSALDQLEEALAANREAVDLYRALASERPVAFNAALALSLNSLSVHLAHLGRREEALAAIQEAVVFRRALALEQPAVFNSDLANSLTNLSTVLSALGQLEEALAVNREAVDLYRALALERPAAFNAALATSLSGLSVWLSGLGQREEALTVVQEAVEFYRALAAVQPAVFNTDFAMSIRTLAGCLSELGQREEALVAILETVDLYRALAAARAAVYNADLANSLNNLPLYLLGLGQLEEALPEIWEAVGLYRALAAVRPAAYNAAFATSLNIMIVRLSRIVNDYIVYIPNDSYT